MNTKLVFFGSGPVATESLKNLTENFQIEAVITKPTTATEMASIVPSTHIYPTSDKAQLDSQLKSKQFQSKVGVLVDFGIIVSQEVIDYFSLGIINSHFSLLPEWRGADPITAALLSGQAKTGVSLMKLSARMDEGDLLAQEKIDIDKNDTGTSLTDKLISLSNSMLNRNLPEYISGHIMPYHQSSEGVSYSSKLKKADGQIDWNKPAERLEREVRAYDIWPKSHTELGDMEVIITKSHIKTNELSDHYRPGDVKINEATGEIFAVTGEDILVIERLKPASKKEMSSQEFIRGYAARINL